ncbi:TetR/AcrR family transcriptional regulator [Brevibacterium sp. VCM10]|uniref:TetR/AcrR family transcriptional regulator n=1 Tax=Brevibacterium sp. VCM10 TaxID=1381751 RepID=UPI0004729468|nr:TetR/AcrR family transcriptional regulator [Brevibacterium sp. VCM10]
MSRWQNTHEALAEAALQLFVEQGFEATGTAQIAQRAGVSEMTLFRHFPSKEALLLDDPFDPRIAEAVRARPADEPPMTAVVEGIRQAWAGIADTELDDLRQRLRIIASAKWLAGAIERSSSATVDAIANALIDRGVPTAAARVVPAAVVAGLSVALLAWAQSETAGLGEAVGTALTALGEH